MVSKQVTVCTIFLALLCSRVRSQDLIDMDLAKINNELDAILGRKNGIASTPDEMEYNEEIDKVQMARNRNGTDHEKQKSLSVKMAAKRQFEYYENRRNELKETINKLLPLAEKFNATLIANALKNALTQKNNYKEYAIASALEQLVAISYNTGMPSNMIGGPIQPGGPSTGPSDLSNFLDILSKFVRAGGHLFSPTVYNQISPPSINSQSDNNLNQQLKDLLKKLNKRLGSLSEGDYDDWLEWFDW